MTNVAVCYREILASNVNPETDLSSLSGEYWRNIFFVGGGGGDHHPVVVVNL